MRRDILLVLTASLLTGAGVFVAMWLTGRAPVRSESSDPSTAATAEEVKRLRQEMDQIQALLREEPPDGLKVVVTERKNIPSRMPVRYADYLHPGHPDCVFDPKDASPGGFMSWRFFAGSRGDPRPESTVFLLATQPDAIPSMMDDLAALDPELVRRLKATRAGCLLGGGRMAALDLKPGDRLKLTGFSHAGIELELEIVGTLPGEKYAGMGIMNDEYLTASFDAYQKKTGTAHPQAANSLNVAWLRVPNRAAFERVKQAVEGSKALADPPVTCRLARSLPMSLLPESP
jgi:hypothetical protein